LTLNLVPEGERTPLQQQLEASPAPTSASIPSVQSWWWQAATFGRVGHVLEAIEEVEQSWCSIS
jgi:hypothetical protein